MNNCEICDKSCETTQIGDGVGSVVRVCTKCLARLEIGKALTDIFDFVWWKDASGIHATHLGDLVVREE